MSFLEEHRMCFPVSVGIGMQPRVIGECKIEFVGRRFKFRQLALKKRALSCGLRERLSLLFQLIFRLPLIEEAGISWTDQPQRPTQIC